MNLLSFQPPLSFCGCSSLTGSHSGRLTMNKGPVTRASSFMNETINSVHERWFNSSHVVLRCDSVPIMIFLQIKLRDGVTRHHLTSQHFQGKMCHFKISSRTNTDTFKCQSMNHREQGVFLLKSNTKSGKAQTPDLTIRKMTMPVFLYLTFSPKRMWNVAAEVSPATIRADKHSLLCQPSTEEEWKQKRG